VCPTRDSTAVSILEARRHDDDQTEGTHARTAARTTLAHTGAPTPATHPHPHPRARTHAQLTREDLVERSLNTGGI
jgi:hypothetical protein